MTGPNLSAAGGVVGFGGGVAPFLLNRRGALSDRGLKVASVGLGIGAVGWMADVAGFVDLPTAATTTLFSSSVGGVVGSQLPEPTTTNGGGGGGSGEGDFVSGDGLQHTIYIQSDPPSNPAEDDIWIDTRDAQMVQQVASGWGLSSIRD